MQIQQKYPIFNGDYQILHTLGEGHTCKVYLARQISNPDKKVAVKLLREEFLSQDPNSIKSVEQEIQILQGLNHKNIVGILGYGSNGHVKKPSGREINNLVYIILEYVNGGLLFDVCQSLGEMGEEDAKFFFNQLCDVMSYMQSKGVAHRDLKLENILVDNELNIKIADFGFATYKKINQLDSYSGTMTYMAPEIKESKQYDGKKTDMFSIGVILFIIVRGIFPFKEAKKDDIFYSLIYNNELDKYWEKIGGKNLSSEFKDLIIQIFSYEGEFRPSIDQIKSHPWMQTKFDNKLSKERLLQNLSEIRLSDMSTLATDGDRTVRGNTDNELIRQVSESALQSYGFTEMREFDINVTPATFRDELKKWNLECYQEQCKIDTNMEKRFIKLSIPASCIEVKIKFLQTPKEQKIRVRFLKKKGDLAAWYSVMSHMKEYGLEDLLSAV